MEKSKMKREIEKGKSHSFSLRENEREQGTGNRQQGNKPPTRGGVSIYRVRQGFFRPQGARLSTLLWD
ncbi:hypothetical protein BZZ01_05695 [Nostocales cyanobacterium HT-58-2]|nr:hypothetical protein BZZ01_05695 [Nostocales cyanobacterium HT-58-2]